MDMAKTKNKKPKKLTPIPPDEAWLYKNPEALASVLRGLQELAEGKTVSLGSFASYADEE
jgi:hypothetical protein